MKKNILFLLAIIFYVNSFSQLTKENNTLYITVDDHLGASFHIENYKSEIFASGIENLWLNKPYLFFKTRERSELETKLFLEDTDDGNRQLQHFNDIRDNLKYKNSFLIVPLKLLNPSFDVESNTLELMKPEDMEFLFTNTLQFEEVVLKKLPKVEIINKRVSHTNTTWNFYRLPFEDLKKALEIEKNHHDMLLLIEFRVSDVTKVPNTFMRTKIEGIIHSFKIVSTDYKNTIWTYN